MDIDQYGKKPKIYTLIGMSGVGKSYWTNKFKEQGYTTYSIDDIISIKLQEIVKAEKGSDSVEYSDSLVGDLAKWMGFPDDARYPKNSKIYLAQETQVTEEVLDKALTVGEDSIIDTTGSVIYIDPKVLQRLQIETTIVFFETSAERLEEMFEEFKRNPKPIIWNNFYAPKPGETEEETLSRCYRELLDSRIISYKRLCHSSVSFDEHRKEGLTVEQLLTNL